MVETPGSQVSRDYSSLCRMPKHLTKNRGLTCCSKFRKQEPKLVERKVALYWRLETWSVRGRGRGNVGLLFEG